MKFALIGATGFVGTAILEEALDRGHEVTAIARDPEKLTPHPKLHLQQGDIYNPDAMARLLDGQDAVISAFSPNKADPDINRNKSKVLRVSSPR